LGGTKSWLSPLPPPRRWHGLLQPELLVEVVLEAARGVTGEDWSTRETRNERSAA